MLYAYGSINNGVIDLSFAQIELDLDDSQIKRGADCLLAYGVCKKQLPKDSDIAASTEEILNLKKTDYGFSGICQVYEGAKGKIMRQPEIESLYNIYVNLNMSADMITLLISFLQENSKFSLKNVEKTAYEWHESEIATYEEAEQYLNKRFAQKSNYRKLLTLLNITGRDPVTEEKKFLDVWIEKAIPPALISLAYEKTIYNLSELRWPYLNKILLNWHEKGFKTPLDVEKGDALTSSKTVSSSSPLKTKASLLLEIYKKERHTREEKTAETLSMISSKSPEFLNVDRQIKGLSQKIALAALSGKDVSALKSQSNVLQAQREKILSLFGLTTEDINPSPNCSICNDYGYIGSQMCKCFKDRLEKM